MKEQIERPIGIKPMMLDPSLLCTVDFWKSLRQVDDVFQQLRVPHSLRLMSEKDMVDFYAGHLPKRRIVNFQEMLNMTRDLKSFHWEENVNGIPASLKESYLSLRSNMGRSKLSQSIKSTLLDEFVFLATQSSILSRLKKSFKVLEGFKSLPLINLEKIAPEEWRSSIANVKKMVSAVRWVATLGGFNLWLGPSAQIVGSAVTGIRIFLIDPA